MSRRLLAILLSCALVGGVFSALPARAQEPPAQPTEVPPVVNIEDPYGDAAANGTQTDIGKVWFTHDASTVSVHFLTNGAPNANSLGFQFVVQAGPEGCLFLEGYYDGSTYTSDSVSRVRDTCNEIDPIYGTFVFAAGPGDEGGLASITVPREGVPSLADGAVIAQPFAQTWVFAGGEQITPTGYRGVRQMVDDTDTGTDYTIAGEEVAKEKKPKKAKKQKAPKPKPKKKKKGKPKPPAAAKCPAYTPGDEGKDAPIAIVTDAATEEKPVELEFDAPPGAGNDLGVGVYDETASLYQNIQVDSAAPETGLYVRYEFADRHDYDLYLNYADGATAANSGDFNIAPGEGLGGGSPDGGWEAGSNYESVLGIKTADCDGYTARLVSYLTTGGATNLKVWLGEIVADPTPPGGQESSFATFWGLLGL